MNTIYAAAAFWRRWHRSSPKFTPNRKRPTNPIGAPALARARGLMAPLLASPAAPTIPTIGIVGHSHIDTARLWPVAETWRKLARTFSSVLSLMEQYPDFKFTQSAAYSQRNCTTALSGDF